MARRFPGGPKRKRNGLILSANGGLITRNRARKNEYGVSAMRTPEGMPLSKKAARKR